jgi:hypothetical protein
VIETLPWNLRRHLRRRRRRRQATTVVPAEALDPHVVL